MSKLEENTSPNRWQRVFAIFEQAIERSPEERASFLDRSCGDDALLRRGVEELLEAHAEKTMFLDRPIVRHSTDVGDPGTESTAVGDTTSDSIASTPEADLPFTTLGPYRILRQIGQGGMSTVYSAAREDDAFRRPMVVKVVRRDMQSEAMSRRLRAERQILAGLEHPNIARLYDGASTDEGMPYFVMEYVEGMPIDRYCEENQLSVDQRLNLFRKVCAAVHYAHQNLVVHRDIKPSNILVTTDGEPKLLDFGIAKLLNPGLGGADIEPTAHWQRLMTPSFASPEQIRGLPITTVSDVYSLGVLLYVLLTGRLPHQFEGRSLREIERLLTETEPPKPSSVVSREVTTRNRDGSGSGPSDETRPRPTDQAPPAEEPGSGVSHRQLTGDLDAIVLKALRATPAQRYVSVERFAADIERFQTGLPVEARDGSWRYRAGKFVGRHRRALSAAALAAVMLTWFASTMALQARRIAAEQEKKARVASLVLEIFELSNPYVAPGEELTVRQALERSSPVVAEGLRAQPEIRAELLHTTGSILRVLGFPRTAIEQLDEALAIRTDLHGEDHLEVAETLSALAAARRDLYEIDQAETLARRAVSVARQRLEPGDPGLVDPLLQLVSVYCARGELENAEPLADEVIALASELPPGSRGEISVLQYLAQAHSRRGEYEEAVALNRRLLELVRGRFGDSYPTLIGTLSNMGMQLRRSGDLDAAKEAYDEALRLQNEIFGESHQDPILINNYAGVHYAAGDFATAERLYPRRGFGSGWAEASRGSASRIAHRPNSHAPGRGAGCGARGSPPLGGADRRRHSLDVARSSKHPRRESELPGPLRRSGADAHGELPGHPRQE